MVYDYATKVKGSTTSAIRDAIIKAQGEGFISFAAGFPDPQAIPIEKLARISQEVIEEFGIEVFQYGDSIGRQELRDQARKFINMDYDVLKESDEILITSGSTQGLYIASKIFVNDGDIILSEDPAFSGAFASFKSNGAIIKGVKMEEDGVDIAALEQAMASEPKPKFFYTIPNFNNPTGYTTSFEKRKAIYELAKKYNVIILEDNPYGYLRSSGDDLPPIKTFDTTGHVLYAASLSKIISPGMRCAMLCGEKDIIGKAVIQKSLIDSSTPIWNQLVMARFLEQTDMRSHIRYISDIYERKCMLMYETMKATFHEDVKYAKPEGGMFIYFELPDYINLQDFVNEAAKMHIAVVPGSAFSIEKPQNCNGVRINFSIPTMDQIIDGITKIGALTHQLCGDQIN